MKTYFRIIPLPGIRLPSRRIETNRKGNTDIMRIAESVHRELSRNH